MEELVDLAVAGKVWMVVIRVCEVYVASLV